MIFGFSSLKTAFLLGAVLVVNLHTASAPSSEPAAETSDKIILKLQVGVYKKRLGDEWYFTPVPIYGKTDHQLVLPRMPTVQQGEPAKKLLLKFDEQLGIVEIEKLLEGLLKAPGYEKIAGIQGLIDPRRSNGLLGRPDVKAFKQSQGDKQVKKYYQELYSIFVGPGYTFHVPLNRLKKHVNVKGPREGETNGFRLSLQVKNVKNGSTIMEATTSLYEDKYLRDETKGLEDKDSFDVGGGVVIEIKPKATAYELYCLRDCAHVYGKEGSLPLDKSMKVVGYVMRKKSGPCKPELKRSKARGYGVLATLYCDKKYSVKYNESKKKFEFSIPPKKSTFLITALKKFFGYPKPPIYQGF